MNLRKRFTIAHEIGHFLLHAKLEVHNEKSNTLKGFNNVENQLQKGIQEWESNDFATELLMPELLFKKEVKGFPFSLKLIADISQRFITRLTSAAFWFLHLNIQLLFIAFIYNGKVKS